MLSAVDGPFTPYAVSNIRGLSDGCRGALHGPSMKALLAAAQFRLDQYISVREDRALVLRGHLDSNVSQGRGRH